MSRAERATADAGPVGGRVPTGFRAVPLSAAERDAAMPLCVLIRDQPHPVQGRLVQLRESIESRAVLGCVVDRAGQVQRWVEIHVQEVAGLSRATPVFRGAVTNSQLDERWRATAKALRGASWGTGPAVIATEWEADHPAPTAIDPSGGVVVAAVDAGGRAWRLCRDESVLAAKGLPSYAGSAHRYLYIPDAGAETPIAAVTPDAPAGAGGTLAEVFPSELVAFNPGGGLLMVRPRAGVSFEAAIDLLGGDPSGAGLRVGPFPDGESVAAGASLQLLGEQGFMSARQNRWARAIEALHLKLRLLADAISAVREMVSYTGRPLLNVSAESFRVELGAPGEGLPLLWTARGVLVAGGDAAALSIPGADEEYFVRPSDAASVYAPDSAGRAVQGRGSLRIRKIEAAGPHGGVVVTGTLTTQERVRPAPSDLAWVRMHAGGEGVDLYARLEADPAAAAGEWRFRTLAQRFSEEARKGMQAAEGVPIADAPFQIIPLLSTPCDLYSLGVLAVRALLVGGGNTLPEAMDELFSLARNATGESGGEPASRIAAVLRSDPRWGEALGPQRVAHGLGTVGEALDAVPLDLWCDVLSLVVRLFPGLGPGAYCRDLGDAPPAGLHAVFDGALADVRALIRRTRGLVIVDWSANREIHSVLRARRTGMGAPRARRGAKA